MVILVLSLMVLVRSFIDHRLGFKPWKRMIVSGTWALYATVSVIIGWGFTLSAVWGLEHDFGVVIGVPCFTIAIMSGFIGGIVCAYKTLYTGLGLTTGEIKEYEISLYSILHTSLFS